MKKIFSVCVGLLFVIFCLSFNGCNNDETASGSFSVNPDTFIKFNTVYNSEYTAPNQKNIYVTNNGSSSVTANLSLSGDDSAFSISASSISIGANTNNSFQVSAKTGLGWGSYKAVVTVSAENYASKKVELRFNVIEPIPEKHLYIAFGQSNMQGPGEIRDQDKENISDRWQVLNIVTGTYGGQNRTKGAWYKAVPPLIIAGNLVNYLGINIGLGPSDHFGQTITNNTPSHITIGLAAVAHGDLALASFHKTKGAEYFADGSTGKEGGRPSDTEKQGWTRYTTTGGYTSIYDAIISNVKKAQTDGWVVKGIIMHQGESGRGLTYTTWQEMLKEIYDDMLSDLSLPPNSVPILMGQLWNAGIGPNGYLNANNTLIKSVIPNAWVISTAGLTTGRVGQGQPDNIHFGSEDLEGLGKRYAEKMQELIYSDY